MIDEFEGRREREHLDRQVLIQMRYRRLWKIHMGIQEIELYTTI